MHVDIGCLDAHCDVHVWNRSGDLLHHTQIYAMSRKAVSAYMPIHLAVNRNDSLLKFCTSSSEVGVEFQIRLWEVSSLETVAVSVRGHSEGLPLYLSLSAIPRNRLTFSQRRDHLRYTSIL